MKYPLMADCISAEEKQVIADFILTSDRYTQGPKTKEFEEAWSRWLGTKYSIFVGSGSAANLLILSAVKELFFEHKTPRILTSVCTWSTNISSCMQMQYDIVFADMDKHDYGIDVSNIEGDVDIVLVTHLMGIPSNLRAIKQRFPKALIIEDCCESHGAVYEGQKVGTHGLASSFSFYFGHHMTTIEGGMIGTNDRQLYNLLLAKRSHGMSREMQKDVRDSYSEMFPDVDPQFLFVTDGFNSRASDLQAVIGLGQIEKLDNSIAARSANYARFKEMVERIAGGNLELPKGEGNSSFCLPFVCKTVAMRRDLKNAMHQGGIETRPFLVGNVMRQPFMRAYKAPVVPNAEHMHHKAFYIGNHPYLDDSFFTTLGGILSEYFNLYDS